MQQLETARDEFDEEAAFYVFRLKSLKQGQSRSLLTQAARHHAAQVFFLSSHLHLRKRNSFFNLMLFFFLLENSCVS